MTNEIITGDALEELGGLDKNSVHMVMTSPPYWNLRDYDHDDQLGLEESSKEFVQNLADILDKVKRVLRDDGSLWLNLGDTYEDKDLQLVPERVALELQDRGWILRNKVTWVKSNPMPEPTKDRLTSTTETIYLFTQSHDYHFNLDTIREPYKTPGRPAGDVDTYAGVEDMAKECGPNGDYGLQDFEYDQGGKNPGDVFEVATKPFPEAHFAVYPPELCEKPIKATCPKDGVVLDPFAGAGTTLLKAKELGRDYIGIELNPEYADMARSRIGLDVNDPSRLREDDESGLEAYQ